MDRERPRGSADPDRCRAIRFLDTDLLTWFPTRHHDAREFSKLLRVGNSQTAVDGLEIMGSAGTQNREAHEEAPDGGGNRNVGVCSRTYAAEPQVYDWTGLYFGAHIGGAFQTTDFSDPTSGQLPDWAPFLASPNGNVFANAPGESFRSNSLLGGFQAGANYQFEHFVFGGEFDMSWTGLNGSTASAPPPSPFFLIAAPPGWTFSATDSLREHTDWIATTTARFGIAANNWLFYGKGGAAFDRNTYTLSHQASVTAAGFGTFLSSTFSSTASDVRVGWTLGAGMEWAFASNWSAKLEYDFMDFGSRSVSLSGTTITSEAQPVGPPVVTSSPATALPNMLQAISEVKLGINYKLSSNNTFAAERRPPLKRSQEPQIHDWTGLYFGGHIGGAFQTTDFRDPTSGQVATDLVPFIPTVLGFANGMGNSVFLNGPAGSFRSNSFLSGFQAGANYRSNISSSAASSTCPGPV